jgi:hypothetical protein
MPAFEPVNCGRSAIDLSSSAERKSAAIAGDEIAAQVRMPEGATMRTIP